METFIFSIVGDPSNDALELEPWLVRAVTGPMWAELAAQMACESHVLPYPAATLAQRAERGYAAAAVAEGRIVSHIALVPLVCRASWPGALHSWAGLCAAAGLGAAQLPALDVYDCASSWTAPAWRGKGISAALHRRLLGHWLADGSLGISATAGAASPRLGQLGWQILAWSAAPFVSSLTGIPRAGFEDCLPAGWQPPGSLARYDGPPLDPCAPGHAWSQFCYFWVSDPALALRLDGELADLCRRDLCRWQRAILEVFNQPGAWHRVAWLL